MLFAAKCYWPGVTRTDLEQVAERAAKAGLASGSDQVSYLGSLLFADDDLVLCLFQGHSRAAVIRASDRLGIPRERLMDSVWLGPCHRTRKERGNDQTPHHGRHGPRPLGRRSPAGKHHEAPNRGGKPRSVAPSRGCSRGPEHAQTPPATRM